jgi:hypothetical protein
MFPDLPAPAGVSGSIKIGHYDFRVRWFSREEEAADANVGYCDTDHLEFGFSRRLEPTHMAEIVIHEVTHAIWYLRKLPARATEEMVCEHHGIGVTQVWRDNPEFFRWWNSLLTMRRSTGQYPVP